MANDYNAKSYLERIKDYDVKVKNTLDSLKESYIENGFKSVESEGLNKTNIFTDLQNGVSVGVSEPFSLPNLGTVNGYQTIDHIPLNGYTKNGLTYVNPTNVGAKLSATKSNTIATDRADGKLTINRWTTRNIIRFKSEYYGYDRCVFIIPLEDLANGIVIDGGDITPHGNTLKNYPYPEEIIMTSEKTEKNFIHFINVQYTDSHYGHFKGRNYNLMIMRDRIRYGELTDDEKDFKTYLSLYVNDVETELAYVKDGNLYLPVPDENYGEEFLNTLWDCRVIWRSDAPTRNISVSIDVEKYSMGGTGWSENNLNLGLGDCFNIAYGNNTYVANFVFVSYPIEKGYLYSIDNGATWKKGYVNESVKDRQYDHVYYGDGKFITPAYYDKYFAYSTNGVDWTETTISSNTRYWSLPCYGNGKYIVFERYSNSAYFAYSSNGVSWTEKNSGLPVNNVTAICYGSDKFVIVMYSSKYFAYSTSGTSWTEVTVGSTNQAWYDVCYGNGKYIVISNTKGKYAYSTDGISWTEGYMSVNDWRAICYGNGMYVVIGSDTTTYSYSKNGISWTDGIISSENRDYRAICYGNNKYIAMTGGANYVASLTTEIPFKDLDLIDDRIQLIQSGSTDIPKDRGNISKFDQTLQGTVSMYSPCILTNSGSIVISPTYTSTYIPKTSSETSWKSTGIPNQIFKITNDTYIGFYYYNTTNRGSASYIDIFNNRTRLLYYALFDNTLKSKNPETTTQEIYPCNSYNNLLDNAGKIIKIFRNEINPSSKISSFYVFTFTGVYKLNCDYSSGELLMEVELLNSYDIKPYFVMRISQEVFWLYTKTSIHSFNSSSKEITQIENASENVLLGRNCAADMTGAALNVVAYDENGFDVNNTTQTVKPVDLCTVLGKYSYVTNSDSGYTICKLKENFSFNTELDPPPQLNRFSWVLSTILSDSTSNFTAVCYGNNKFVAAGNYEKYFAFSSNGISWTKTYLGAGSLNTTNVWTDVCYGNNFVAVQNIYTGDTQCFAYSSDGISWTLVSTGISRAHWQAVCYGNGKYVAVAYSSNYFIYSTDAVNWTVITTEERDWRAINYGNGKFISLSGDYSDNASFAYSTNGTSWTVALFDSGKIYPSDIVYGKELYVASGIIYGNSAYSTDGITWTFFRMKGNSICYDGNMFVSHSLNTLYYSEDGIVWKTETSYEDLPTQRMRYGDNKYVIVGNKASSACGTYHPVIDLN